VPIALLIQETSQALAIGTRQQAAWAQFVSLGGTIFQRVRSAFLTRWWGPSYPRQGTRLRISILNLEELRTRYDQVEGSRGYNLTEPLAGMAGMLGGQLMTPVQSLVTMGLAAKAVPQWWMILLTALATLSWPVFGYAAVAILAAFFGAVGVGITLAAPGLSLMSVNGRLGAIHRTLGSLARAVPELERFWKLLTRPVEKIANPVFKKVVELAIQLGKLLPHVMALVALAIDRVGPMLKPLAAQIQPFLKLIEEVGATVAWMFRDALSTLEKLWSGPASLPTAFGKVVDALLGLWPRLQRGLLNVWDKIVAHFLPFAVSAVIDLAMWWPRAKAFLESQTSKHPYVRLVIDLIAAVKRIVALLKSHSWVKTPKASKPPGFVKQHFLDTWDEIKKRAGDVYDDVVAKRKARGLPGEPGFPAMPTIDIDAMLKRAGAFPGKLDFALSYAMAGLSPSPFELDAKEQTALRRARFPKSVFAAELARLTEAGQKEPFETLINLRERELALRERLLGVIFTLVPQVSKKIEPKMRELFDKVDPHYPVKNLPRSRRLKVEIGRVRVRLKADTEPASTRAWAEELGKRLLLQEYLAPEGV